VSETNPPSPPGTLDVIVDPASPTASSSFVHAPEAKPQPASTSASAPYRLRGPRRRWTIILGITTTVMITALSLTLLYLKWYRTVDYNALIIASGNPAWEDATATVSGPALGNDVLSAKFTASKNYMIRFHVPPGTYKIVVKSRDGKVLAANAMQGGLRGGYQWWPFRDALPASRPAM